MSRELSKVERLSKEIVSEWDGDTGGNTHLNAHYPIFDIYELHFKSYEMSYKIPDPNIDNIDDVEEKRIQEGSWNMTGGYKKLYGPVRVYLVNKKTQEKTHFIVIPTENWSIAGKYKNAKGEIISYKKPALRGFGNEVEKEIKNGIIKFTINKKEPEKTTEKTTEEQPVIILPPTEPKNLHEIPNRTPEETKKEDEIQLKQHQNEADLKNEISPDILARVYNVIKKNLEEEEGMVRIYDDKGTEICRSNYEPEVIELLLKEIRSHKAKYIGSELKMVSLGQSSSLLPELIIQTIAVMNNLNLKKESERTVLYNYRQLV
ncbi:hypothetical protein, partial [Clostridium sp.]|uniref:hypothetical protein n=1 Tax=Clostridium sp. TaxID=1506 RepID=UPI00284543DB